MFHQSENGSYKAYVCLVCDEMLKPEKVDCLTFESLQKYRSILKLNDHWNEIPGCSSEMENSYKYRDQDDMGTASMISFDGYYVDRDESCMGR